MAENVSYTFQEIKQKLVNYCVYQDRCHAEVEQKMRDFLLIPEAKDELLLFLMKENYLNEERFARSYARGKFYMKKWGKNKIKQHLLQKGITEKLISKALQEIEPQDYKATLSASIEKLWPTYKGLKLYQKKQKIIKYLISRGYEYDLILEQLSAEN